MKNKTTKILQTVSTFLIVATISCGQSIIADGKEIEPNANTKIEASQLFDSLIGTWELVKTIRYENRDTIIQEPSIAPWARPGAKPLTTIRIDSLRNFEIDQICMKCPYLFPKGQLEIGIRTFRRSRFFYLNFIDNRFLTIKNKKRKEKFSLELSGYLTNFVDDEMTLADNERREWIYKRIKNEEK
ncbi:MAG: hypothetical protein AAF741_15345 [Bacteroidota bacterium]